MSLNVTHVVDTGRPLTVDRVRLAVIWVCTVVIVSLSRARFWSNKQTNLWQNVIHNVRSVLHVDVSLTEQVATALLVKYWFSVSSLLHIHE